MRTYDYKYRRYLGSGKFTKWEVVPEVQAHDLNKETDTMLLIKKDGSQKTIVQYRECEIELGVDWVLAVKSAMEEEAKASVQLKDGIGETGS